MTTMAISNTRPRPCTDCWNAWAAPWNVVVTVDGKVAAAVVFTASTASPSANPGFRLNEIVTEGSCPVCATTDGPTLVTTCATVSRGISRPLDERTYSIDSARGSPWNCGATCMMT